MSLVSKEFPLNGEEEFDIQDLLDGLNSLKSSVDELTNKIEATETQIERNESKIETEKGWRKLLLIVLVVQIVFSILLGITAYQGYQSNKRLNTAVRNVGTIQHQALCPLFGIFIGVYDPESQPAAQRDDYIRNFQKIFSIVDVLDCTKGDLGQ